MFKKVKAVFLWAIGVLLIYGAIAVFYYGLYVVFFGGGPLVEVYVGDLRQIFSFGPELALIILSVTMMFVGKEILTKKNKIDEKLTDEKFRGEKETLVNKLGPYHADENREKLWEDRFDENGPEIDFETINDPGIDFETIDLLLEPTSGHRANCFDEDESEYEIETIDLSFGLLSVDRANGFDKNETDPNIAPTNQTPEDKSPDPKKYLDEDDTELEYPEEE